METVYAQQKDMRLAIFSEHCRRRQRDETGDKCRVNYDPCKGSLYQPLAVGEVNFDKRMPT